MVTSDNGDRPFSTLCGCSILLELFCEGELSFRFSLKMSMLSGKLFSVGTSTAFKSSDPFKLCHTGISFFTCCDECKATIDGLACFEDSTISNDQTSSRTGKSVMFFFPALFEIVISVVTLIPLNIIIRYVNISIHYS